MESVWELVYDILFQGRQVQPQAKMEQDGKAVVDLFGAGGVQAVEHCRRAGYDQNTAKSISPALAGGQLLRNPGKSVDKQY